MIAKITRGATAGGLAAYLHGPGRANEHVYEPEVALDHLAGLRRPPFMPGVPDAPIPAHPRHDDVHVILAWAPVRRETSRSLSSGEHSRALRTGMEPPRHNLARRVSACADAARGLGRETFEEVLAAQGVAFRANVASTGRVSGYSFALPDHVDAAGEVVWWKGSQLDRCLSWKALGESLSAPLPAPRVEVAPKKLLERTSTYQQRVEAAQREAVARDMTSRRMGAYRVAETAVNERAKGAALPWRLRQKASERHQIGKKRAAFWAPARRGGEPIGDLSVETIERIKQHRRLSAASFPHSPQATVARGLMSRPENLGARPRRDWTREQTQDRNRDRSIGR